MRKQLKSTRHPLGLTAAPRSRVGRREESRLEIKNESLKARVERKSATISQYALDRFLLFAVDLIMYPT